MCPITKYLVHKKRASLCRQLLHSFMMMAADGFYIYYGRDDEVVPPNVTRVRIDKSLAVIPFSAFEGNRNIEELECHDRVKTVGAWAFYKCSSLRLVIMRDVKVVEGYAFSSCETLTDVECDKLERIGLGAFDGCDSLRSINLPSVKVAEAGAFKDCKALTNVKFGKDLETIEGGAFRNCTSLERITIPLKGGIIITHDNIFQGCENLEHVDLVEGEVLRKTIAALLLDEWRNDMDEEIGAINQSLPNTAAGDSYYDDVGGKTRAIRMWISSVLRNIVHYKAVHRSYVNEAATTLQSYLPNDIVFNNVLPFLELPSYTFEGED